MPTQMPPLLEVSALTKHFPVRSGLLSALDGSVRAVDGVSFSLAEGEVLGIVGESGCGKSTLARLLMGLITPDSGRVALKGRTIEMRGGSLLDLRRTVQMVFQDSGSSLNPRRTILDAISFAPRVHGKARTVAEKEARDLLDLVGLSPAQFEMRYPHELSGGQRQRVNIARALALDPKILILDESVSALDKSVEAQILNLLLDLKSRFALTYIFISHDLNVIEYLCDRVLVMYLGEVVESGSSDVIFRGAAHPYTRALLASKPSIDPRRRTEAAPITGDPPSPINPPSGCRFRTRCRHAEDVCAQTPPRQVPVEGQRHQTACHMIDPISGHSGAQA